MSLAITSEPAPGGSERRAMRQRAFLRAKVLYLDGSITYDCSVIQISATGAKIAIAAGANIPERFRIEIPQRRIDSEARLVRRDPESAAIAFEAAEERQLASPSALQDRIRILEAENKALRVTCKALTEELDQYKVNY